MLVTVSLTEKAIEDAAKGIPTDIVKMVRDHGSVEVLRVFGRGRFVSIETDAKQLDKLKAAIGNVCVFAPATKVQPFAQVSQA